MHQHRYGDPHDHEGGELEHDHPLVELMRHTGTDMYWAECRIPGDCVWTSPPISAEKYDDEIVLIHAAVLSHLTSKHGVPHDEAQVFDYPDPEAAQWN